MYTIGSEPFRLRVILNLQLVSIHSYVVAVELLTSFQERASTYSENKNRHLERLKLPPPKRTLSTPPDTDDEEGETSCTLLVLCSY
jgi:hypothetical protein